MLKRVLCFLLPLLLVFSFSGCELLSDEVLSDEELYEFLEIVTEDEEKNGSSDEQKETGKQEKEEENKEKESKKEENESAKKKQENKKEENGKKEKESGIAGEITEDGWYYSVEEVAAYIHKFGHLPSNYITKTEAQKLGWDGGNLKRYAEGKCIGGGYFGNYEGILPEKKGRIYTECDIGTLGKKNRGSKRIVFSNDGLIYYTDDHYETFTLLYGDEGQ